MKSIDIIVETPKDSREKYKYDPEKKLFRLHKILPVGMSFPYAFGFIPHTIGEDGDPLDVLVLSEFITFTGCMMSCRLIGALLAEQVSMGKTFRNDRFFMVPFLSNEFKHIKTINDLPKKLLIQLVEFFTLYNLLDKKEFRVLKLVRPAAALKIIKENKK
jgi:inorganic pyrophosphatase